MVLILFKIVTGGVSKLTWSSSSVQNRMKATMENHAHGLRTQLGITAYCCLYDVIPMKRPFSNRKGQARPFFSKRTWSVRRSAQLVPSRSSSLSAARFAGKVPAHRLLAHLCLTFPPIINPPHIRHLLRRTSIACDCLPTTTYLHNILKNTINPKT